MSLNVPTNIKGKYGSLILVSAIPSLLAFVGFTFVNYFENTPSSFDAMQMWGIAITIVAFVYAICGTLTYLNERRAGLGILIVVVLCVFTIVITIDSFRSLPYFDECDKLSDVSDISMSECMNVVDMNAQYTGQEIIDVVESGKTVEKVISLEILSRPLKP